MRTYEWKGCKTDRRGNTEEDVLEQLDSKSWPVNGKESKTDNRLQTATSLP